MSTEAPKQMTVVVQLDQVFAQVMLHAAAAKMLPVEYLDYLEKDVQRQVAQQTIVDLSPQVYENVARMRKNLRVVRAFAKFRVALDSAGED